MLCMVVAYFAVWLGDFGHQRAVSGFGVPDGRSSNMGALVVFVTCIIVCAIIGFSYPLTRAMMGRWSWTVRDEEFVALASAELTMACFVYGVLGGPVAAFGPYPWHWVSAWNIIPVLSGVPMAFAIHSCVEDLVSAGLTKRVASDAASLERNDAMSQ